MEPKDQLESEAPAAQEDPRAGEKSPQSKLRLALAGIKPILHVFQYSKNLPRLPLQLFALVKANKLASLTVIASGIAILLPVQTYFWYQIAKRQREFSVPVKAEQIYSALERGDYAETKILAKRLMSQKVLLKTEVGVAPFALGAVAVFEAEAMNDKNRQKQYLLASRYLEEADACGFPDEHRGEGLYLYGKSLFETREFAKSRAVLAKAIKADPRHKTEIYSLLADAYLNEPKPKLAEAMGQNVVYLDDKKLSAADRQQGLLQKARIQLRMDKFEECRATLKEIPENSKDYAVSLVLSGQVSMREAEMLRGKDGAVAEDNQVQFREKYQEAIKTLRLAESRAELGSGPMRQSMYLIGVCFMEMGDTRAANDQFTRLHKIYRETPEGAAACLQVAELSRRASHEMEMLSEYRRVLGTLDNSIPYFNPWLPLDELKSRLMNAYQQYLGVQQFEICLQVIGLMKFVVPPEQWRLMQGELHTKWGQFLANSAEKTPLNKREPMLRLAREQFRRAGRSYLALAEVYADRREYSDQIWNAAASFLQGHNYTRAASLLREFMQNEVQRRRPQALDSLGESLLCLGDYDAALESLKECVDLFPRDAAACHARLLASQAAREKGDFQEAEKMLLANLNGDYLTPASKEWRESLFLLGDLLHNSGRYTEAARRLEEAITRYPDLPETIQSRYLLADSCRRIAFAMQDKLKKDVTGSSRETQSKLIRDNFEKSLAQYRTIQEKLGGDRDLAELSVLEKTILRNAIFSIGDVLFAEGEYDRAIKAYSIATNRFQNRPEVLDAYVQIANAYRLLDKPHEANNALAQAKLLLSRIKPDVSFKETSIYTRDQWSKRLDELQEQGRGV
jgi:TolA-binding protein